MCCSPSLRVSLLYVGDDEYGGEDGMGIVKGVKKQK